MTELKQYATFYVNGFLFGVEVLGVQEVLKYQEMTTMPLAPPEISGLINLRGQITTAIDLRRRLQMPDREDSRSSMNMVVRTGGEVVSFQVDKIGDVLDISSDKFEEVPNTVSEATRAMVLGVYKLDNELLMVLNAAKAASLDKTSE